MWGHRRTVLTSRPNRQNAVVNTKRKGRASQYAPSLPKYNLPGGVDELHVSELDTDRVEHELLEMGVIALYLG